MIPFDFAGDVRKGDLGTAALPGKEEDFKKSIQMAVDYAKALKCNRLIFNLKS